MIGLIGKKLGMSHIFKNEQLIPVTVIEVQPNRIVQLKTKEKEKYSAVQLGAEVLGEKKAKKISQPLQGHFKKSHVPPCRILREFVISAEEEGQFKVGEELKIDLFKEGEKVDVTGTSKGRGFTGVVKRHGFRGGRATRGSMFHRAPGSIGASATPSHVHKGKRLPGRMGGSQVTVQNLTIEKVDTEKNLLLIKGAVPGANKQFVLIKKQIKVPPKK